MTTSEEVLTQDSETTESSPRDLTVLNALGTFQGMTDEEVEIVIQYRIDQALASEEFKLREALIMETQNAVAESGKQANDLAVSQMNAVLQSVLELGKIDENGEVVNE